MAPWLEAEVLKLWTTFYAHTFLSQEDPSSAFVCNFCPHSSHSMAQWPKAWLGPLSHCNNQQLTGGNGMLPLIQALDQVSCIPGLLRTEHWLLSFPISDTYLTHQESLAHLLFWGLSTLLHTAFSIWIDLVALYSRERGWFHFILLLIFALICNFYEIKRCSLEEKLWPT